MAVQYACGAERRRAEVRSRGVDSGINGIDYLEVAEDQKVLTEALTTCATEVVKG